MSNVSYIEKSKSISLLDLSDVEIPDAVLETLAHTYNGLSWIDENVDVPMGTPCENALMSIYTLKSIVLTLIGTSVKK